MTTLQVDILILSTFDVSQSYKIKKIRNFTKRNLVVQKIRYKVILERSKRVQLVLPLDRIRIESNKF